MDYKYYSVIDVRDRYKTLVLAVNEPDETGEAQEKIQFYTLLEGERLIDAAPPVMRLYAGADGFIKPAWDGSEWRESATNEEITEWEAEYPAPTPAPPSESERLTSLEMQMTDAQIAITENYETADGQNTDAMLALAEVYETMIALQTRVASLEGGGKANG